MSSSTKVIVLKSSDGETFDIDEMVALDIGLFRPVIEDGCADGAILQLPNVTGRILSKVIEYCKKHAEAPKTEDKVAEEDLKSFDADFVKVDRGNLFDLILAADYLNIKSLLDLTCQTVADLIKGMTPDDVRKTFNIENDFTPEQEEEVHRENAQAFVVLTCQRTTLMMETIPSSVHVMSQDNLLKEILVKLPVVALLVFKSVSKRWLSLIKDSTSIKLRSIDPPSGLFIKKYFDTNVYGFAPLDTRIRPRLENTLPSNAKVLQSCNGLFLCSVMSGDGFFVCNPTVSMWKMLPNPYIYSPHKHCFISMDFNPSKSPHYKVVFARAIEAGHVFHIETYSSETSKWSTVCHRTNPGFAFKIYLNDAMHWLGGDCDRRLHYKLDFVNENTVTNIELPVTVASEYCKLYESCGCLLLLGMDKTSPKDQLNIYVMRNGAWTFKYSVNHSRIKYSKRNFPDIYCINVGEKESFIVLEIDGRVLLYDFLLKTFCELPEVQSMLSQKRKYHLDNGSFLFTVSLASV